MKEQNYADFSIDDINRLQYELEQIKKRKLLNETSRPHNLVKCKSLDNNYLNTKPVSRRPNDNLVQSSLPRFGERNREYNRMNNRKNNSHNPYSYGAPQNSLDSRYADVRNRNFQPSDDMTNVFFMERFPGDVRNVNVESVLLQKENTKLRGQRDITEYEINRFNYLPFDPQDHRHIVWTDGMPRGGVATRTDRLELS